MQENRDGVAWEQGEWRKEKGKRDRVAWEKGRWEIEDGGWRFKAYRLSLISYNTSAKAGLRRRKIMCPK